MPQNPIKYDDAKIEEGWKGKRKGIWAIRLERKLEPILEAWRKAMRDNPEEWK